MVAEDFVQPALTLNIFKTQDSNLVAVGDQVAQAVEQLRKVLPPDVEIRSISENSQFVKNSLDSVKRTIIEGGHKRADYLFRTDTRDQFVCL